MNFASAIGKSVAGLEEKLDRVRTCSIVAQHVLSPWRAAESAGFLERCQCVLAEIEEYEIYRRAMHHVDAGGCRPPLVSMLVLPVLNEFMHVYPKIALNFYFTDQILNVIEGDFDAAMQRQAKRFTSYRSLAWYILFAAGRFTRLSSTAITPHRCHRFATTTMPGTIVLLNSKPEP
ncbi:MAG: hypothetical protein ACSLEL_00850 [Candidatus Malihini olakiniferum]